ncbi:MAG: ABC transporter, permease protein 1 (cluster 5, nickel/peptides/opines), partial [uncultured Rubellimicrobium sp.]
VAGHLGPRLRADPGAPHHRHRAELCGPPRRVGDDRDGLFLAGDRQLSDHGAVQRRHERGARRDARDRGGVHRHQQGLGRAVPHPRPEEPGM